MKLPGVYIFSLTVIGKAGYILKEPGGLYSAEAQVRAMGQEMSFVRQSNGIM
jgi:hypothetical protein